MQLIHMVGWNSGGAKYLILGGLIIFEKGSIVRKKIVKLKNRAQNNSLTL